MVDATQFEQRQALVRAAKAVATAGLVDAFGHVSVRLDAASALITPPVPLSRVDSVERIVPLPLEAGPLPTGAPREAWLHVALLLERPDIGAVCRAQPRAAAALAAIDTRIGVPNGHAAMLGTVAVHPDSRLIRDRDAAARFVRSAGPAVTILLRGNGAVTVGADLPQAVARMWVLERTAELLLAALSAGRPRDLPDDERDWWQERSDELLPRIYDHLAAQQEPDPRHEQEPT